MFKTFSEIIELLRKIRFYNLHTLYCSKFDYALKNWDSNNCLLLLQTLPICISKNAVIKFSLPDSNFSHRSHLWLELSFRPLNSLISPNKNHINYDVGRNIYDEWMCENATLIVSTGREPGHSLMCCFRFHLFFPSQRKSHRVLGDMYCQRG